MYYFIRLFNLLLLILPGVLAVAQHSPSDKNATAEKLFAYTTISKKLLIKDLCLATRMTWPMA